MEKGAECNTLHIQGYIEMKHPVRFKVIKEILGQGIHVEARKGNRQQAIQYVLKSETRDKEHDPVVLSMKEGVLIESPWEEYLTSMTKTKTTTALRLQSIRERLNKQITSITNSENSIDNGTIDNNTLGIAETDFDLWVRYYKAFEHYIMLNTKPRNFECNVELYYGPTGTGKSKTVMELYPNAYWKQRSNWWDGYSGQPTIIFDEYYGWLPFDLLLRVCDRYPLLVESKGGQRQFVGSLIIFTSNTLIGNWYSDKCYLPSLIRRFTKFHYLPELNIIHTFDNYDEFIKYIG